MEYIPFEKPIAELETKIDQLKRTASSQAINLDGEIESLQRQAAALRKEIFSNLDPYQAVQISRHPRRPNFLELVGHMCSEFVELHGDRNYMDDKAVVGGLARMGGVSIMLIGHQKGRGTRENIIRNFGMPKPEGYRKALRLMSMAERFKLPIVTLIDTPGAYPGVGAEERGQSEAIGKNIMVMSKLRVPIVSVVIGEGGSGGALALAVANRVHMLKYASYSVISPEGCASILMNDASKAPDAAKALKITATSAKSLGVIDSIIDEPEGGAHRAPIEAAKQISKKILSDLMELSKMDSDALRHDRQTKFLAMGKYLN